MLNRVRGDQQILVLLSILLRAHSPCLGLPTSPSTARSQFCLSSTPLGAVPSRALSGFPLLFIFVALTVRCSQFKASTSSTCFQVVISLLPKEKVM